MRTSVKVGYLPEPANIRHGQKIARDKYISLFQEAVGYKSNYFLGGSLNKSLIENVYNKNSPFLIMKFVYLFIGALFVAREFKNGLFRWTRWSITIEGLVLAIVQ